MHLVEKFEELRRREEVALMPYICLGYPNIKSTFSLVDAVVKGGADILELGLAFSDPIADGRSIQLATQKALEDGITTEKYFEMAERIATTYPSIALVAMTYYNLPFRYGLAKFCERCNRSGISGIIVPDLPVEESEELRKFCSKYDLALVPLVAPTTTLPRLRKILKEACGFVYLISVRGVTGAREKLPDEVRELVRRVKSNTSLPICLGFGIKSPKQVAQAVEWGVDGVIVGSAIVDIVENSNSENAEKKVGSFIRELKNRCYKFE